MAASARAFTLSRVTNLSPKPPFVPLPFSHQLLRFSDNRRFSSATVSCLSGGGVSNDDFVSTRKSNFDRGFLVIANMLKRIEPLDTSVISKGVSDSAKDSMKQTISSMLGLLPSDQFSVTVRVSKKPLDSLVVSAIITGYTLWNAEYRVSLTRNFDISGEDFKRTQFSSDSAVLYNTFEEKESKGDEMVEELEKLSPHVLGDLSPEALNYIQNLQSELSDVKEELNTMKQKNTQIEYDRGSRNNLLEYLRSLDPPMVNELSRPSSTEVEEIIHQLAQNILHRFFKDDATSNLLRDTATSNTGRHQETDNENCQTVGTSRDYLAKLLFWCMLLGHHLRGLENRLHVTCVVGLL